MIYLKLDFTYMTGLEDKQTYTLVVASGKTSHKYTLAADNDIEALEIVKTQLERFINDEKHKEAI